MGLTRFVFLILELAICVCGSALVVAPILVRQGMMVKLFSASDCITLVVLGGIAIALGMLGIAVWYVFSTPLLRIYGIVMLVFSIVLACISLQGLLIGSRTVTYKVQQTQLMMSNIFLFYNHSKIIKKKIDAAQRSMKCCGVIGPEQWRHNYEYPASCCPRKKSKKGVCALRDVYKTGCGENFAYRFPLIIKILYSMVMIFAGICTAASGLAFYITCVPV